jgi:hypothetical protein
MRLISLILNPAFIAITALFLSVIWMLRDEKDNTRPWLVLALTLNVFFSFLLTTFMGREGGLLPLKYDPALFRIDDALGMSAATIARPLQGFWHVPLIVVYQLMVPMMIVWFLVTRYWNQQGSVVLAYAAELVAGPMLYAVLPACGPRYAFGAAWLHPTTAQVAVVRLVGMPNAFPSLHIATALVLLLFAPTRAWRGVSLLFLAGTAAATLSTGEHYVIDLIAGLAFGCFAASIGYRRFRNALVSLAVVFFWSLAVRLQHNFLVAHPGVLRLFAASTVVMAISGVIRQWSSPFQRARKTAPELGELPENCPSTAL